MKIEPFLYVSECKKSIDGSNLSGSSSKKLGVPLIAGGFGISALLMASKIIDVVSSSSDINKKNEVGYEPNHDSSSIDVPSNVFTDAFDKILANASGLMVKTLGEINELGCMFPPGHPLPGKLYRLHPLAEFSASKKSNLYIPSDTYHDVLYAEREAELIRILVYLGSVRISIRKSGSIAGNNAKKLGLRASNTSLASTSVGFKNDNTSSGSTLDTRTFLLEGYPWKRGDILDRTLFSWLPYEPSWESMVDAREIGGCTQAMIELKKVSAFSSRSVIEASINYGLNALEVESDSSRISALESSYIVEAEFSSTSPT